MKRPSIAIIGPGRVGSALAARLGSAGYRIREIICRSEPTSRARTLARRIGAQLRPISQSALDSDLVWLCIPDSQIASLAGQLRNRDWKGKIVFHSSGVLTSSALTRLRAKGASVASVHPLMTFTTGSVPDLNGVPFALEGDARAMQTARMIVRGLGGVPFAIEPRAKAAYHAFATMICPLLVSLIATSERVATLAGISAADARRRMVPIIRQTLANYQCIGAQAAFTGPIVRGDIDTVRLHLKALAREPMTAEVYRALARAALQYLPSKKARELADLLSQPGKNRRNSKRTDRGSKRSTLRR